MPAVRQEREDASHLSREGGCQPKLFVEGGTQREGSPSAKGRMGPFIEGGRTPAIHREREDTSHTLREGGHLLFVEGGRPPFIEGGRPPFVEGGRRPFIDLSM